MQITHQTTSGLRRYFGKALDLLHVLPFHLTNLFSKGRVTDPSSRVIVSLTTHGHRLSTVHLTLESIAAGMQRPRRLILWLDTETAIASLPRPLQRMKSRGLEVCLSENYGPHTKYYPQVLANSQLPLVIADDDVTYPPYWLYALIRAHNENPKLVHAHRAWKIAFSEEGGVGPYAHWTLVTDRKPSFRNVATGVGGMILPVELQQSLAARGDKFRESARTADDLWLHHTALRAGIPVAQVNNQPILLRVIPLTQSSSLNHLNVDGGHNDSIARTLYGADDLTALAAQV